MIQRVNIQRGWRKLGGVDLLWSRGTCETWGKGQFSVRSMCNPAVDVTGSSSEGKKNFSAQDTTTHHRLQKQKEHETEGVKKLANVFVGKGASRGRIYPHGLFGEFVSCAPSRKGNLCWRQEQPRPSGGRGGRVVEPSICLRRLSSRKPYRPWTSQEWRLVGM